MHTNNQSEAIYYNALASENRGNLTAINKLFEKYSSWESAFKKTTSSKIDPEKEFHRLEEEGVSLLLENHDLFPPLLKEIPYPPKALYIKGNIESKNPVAIVGTRKASKPSLLSATEIAKNLAQLSVSIISGLALGVDSYAHKGALAGKGHTIAVLACGLDKVYPSSNDKLAKQILEGSGALISEYPLGTEPLKPFFIARNRIISGLSLATLVIEAPQRSGALATARFAVEQNRDLYVLAGSARDKNFLGSNRLIQDGASLLIDYHDIAKDFGIDKASTPHEKFDKLSKMQTIIVNALKKLSDPASIEDLVELTGFSITELQTNLTQLILDELLIEEAGRYSIR